MAVRITHHIRFSVVFSAALLAALLVSALALAPRAEAFVYWTSEDGVGRADLDGSDPDPNFIITDINGFTCCPPGIAVDADHIYWTVLETGSGGVVGKVGRANLDGTSVDPSFVPPAPPGSVDVYAGVAADADHLYWVHGFDSTASYHAIGRANLDGTNVDQSFIGGLSTNGGLAVDANHVYWADSSGGSRTIARADLGGTNIERNFVTGADTSPYAGSSIAVDADHIYWANDVSGAIDRADLDGTNIERGFIEDTNANGIAVDANYIYWTDPDTHAIGRAELDGTGVDRDFVTGASGGAIAVDALTFPETTITSGPDGLTKDATASFAFSADHPGATFECRLDSAPFAPCVSPKSYEELPDGPHTFWVRATDPGGYADPSPASRKFTVDTRVNGEASAKKAQAQSGTKIVVKAKVKAKEDLEVKATGKVKTRRRDGCLVGRESEPKPCKVGFKLQRVNKSVGSGKKKTLKLKATDAGNRRLVKLVEKGRKAKAKLRIELTDEAGNEETTKLKVKLKRAG